VVDTDRRDKIMENMCLIICTTTPVVALMYQIIKDLKSNKKNK